MRLHPDSGFNEGLFVAYDDDGNVNAQGYLEVDEDGVVRFVNVLTEVQRPAARA
jgi:hypothetical protein